MRRSSSLEDRLTEWCREYGGGRYEDTGWQGLSPLAQLIKYHGRPPQGLEPVRSGCRTQADDVQDAVAALAAQREGYPAAQALRVEYLTPGLANDSRRQRLGRIGVRVSRAQYYHLLRIGRIHVAAWIRVAFSEAVDEIENSSCV